MPPVSADTLVFYDLADPPTLDPARSWGFFDGRLIGLVFSNLVRFDRNARIMPDLAQSWEISTDGKEYLFAINPNAKFSDGTPVTPEDVQFSFNRVMNPATASPSKWIFDKVVDVTPAGAHSIKIRLKQPFAPFLQMLAMPSASIVSQKKVLEIEKHNQPFGESPFGSGPWLFKEWQHDQYISFERNESYWGPKPKTKYLKQRIISNPFTAIAEFETGNTAIIEPLPMPEIIRWKTHPFWKNYLTMTPLLETDMLVFNCQKEPFSSREVRQAVCMALEPPLILNCVREGAGVVSSGPIPPGIAGHTSGQLPIPFQPDKAKSIIEKHRLAGKELVLLLPSVEGFYRTAGEVLQADLKKTGLAIRILQTEWVTYRRMLREGEFDIAMRTWWADYPDGDNFLYPLFHSSQIGAGNVSRFQDSQIDQLIEESEQVMDSTERTALLQKIDDLVVEKAPAVFLWHRANFTVRQPWLQGYSVPTVFNGIRYDEESITTPASQGKTHD